ncbi:MAG: CAP domain-containing protein [Patescibacteria group bacterium]
MPKISKVRKIVLAALLFGISFGVARADSFPDVPRDHPNAAAIDYLSKESVISGYPDGTFRPENSVNRAEALKILLLASGAEIQNPTQNVFPDVQVGQWFAPFVFSAKQKAIVAGYLDGSFRPEQTVNLVEALKILLNTNSVDLTNYSTNRQLFADSEKNAWYNPFLFYAQTFELIDSDSANRVHPAQPLTRGALAEIVYRFAMRIDNVCPRFFQDAGMIPETYFHGLTLSSDIPRIFYENEIFTLHGLLQNLANGITAILENPNDKTQKQFAEDLNSSAFAIPVSVGAPGSYNFTLIPEPENSNTGATITVLPRECVPAITTNSSATVPSNITTNLTDNKPIVAWSDADNNIFRVVIRQGEQRVEKLVSGGEHSLALDPADFQNFTAGLVTIQIFGAKSANGWSSEPRTNWTSSAIMNVSIGQHNFSQVQKSKITINNLPTYRAETINFTATATVDLESSIYLITPRGKVTENKIAGFADTIPAGQGFSVNLDLPESGTYILEINGTDGIAVVNYPLYLPGQLPLLPDFADLRQVVDNSNLSLTRERALWLKLVNDFRAQNQLSKVELDDQLSNFAQNYAVRMARENFFGHTDPQGRDPETRRLEFGLALPVGENLARDSATEYAQAGLLRSAAHRQNMVEPEWTRVGLGIARDSSGRLLFVQEFSAAPLTATNLSEFRTQLLGLINARRTELGQSNIVLDGQLSSAVQSWSEKMVAENFTDFKSPDGSSLENLVRAAGHNGAFSSFIASAARLAQVAESLSAEVLADNTKTRVAIGLAQNSTGRLIATLIFR